MFSFITNIIFAIYDDYFSPFVDFLFMVFQFLIKGCNLLLCINKALELAFFSCKLIYGLVYFKQKKKT